MTPSPAAPHEAFFLLTGGPGAGKTALIEALEARGVATRPENARAVIRAQRAAEGPARPHRDTRLFAEHVLACDLVAYDRALAEAGGAPVVFDRGLPDILGHLRALDLEAPAHLRRAARLRPYARPVFLAPHWPEIYARDAERAQSEAEARRVCEVMREICLELGHEIVELPLASPAARAEFVLARIAAHRPAA